MSLQVLMVHALGGRRGPARTMALLARHVARASDVLIAAPEGFMTSTLQDVPRIRIEPIPRSRFRAISWITGSARISQVVVAGSRPDVIHANGLSALNLVGLTARRHGIPVFVHFHHGDELGLRTRLLARWWPRLGVDVQIAPVSQAALNVLTAAGLAGYADAILPNPIEGIADTFARTPHRPLRIGFVGSRSPRKGLHLLVAIAEGLVEKELEWLVFGIDPRDRSAYVELCRQRLIAAGLEERVVWAGKFADPHLAFAQMDILLVPSLQESWCRVAMEGMAAGVPVVGTSIPGLSEVLGLVEDAPRFEPHHPDVAIRHIRQLADDTDLRLELAQRGKKAVQRFDVELVGRELLHRYENVTRKRPSVSV